MTPRQRQDLVVGLVVVAVLGIVVTLVFGGGLPFVGRSYEIRADVSSASELRAGSPVRLSGVDIGRVTAVRQGPEHVARLTLRIDRRASSIHSDARIAIRPRLALGGNDYVDLSLGTPTAPRMPEGGLITLERTSTTVGLDEVVDVFTLPIREAFTGSLSAFSAGLGPAPGGGGRGALGLRRAAGELDASLGDLQLAARALQGQHPGDLTRAVHQTGEVTQQLARDPRSLADLVTNYDRVFAQLAAHDADVRATVRGLDQLLTAGPKALAAIDAGLPGLRRLALLANPTLRAAPSALHSGTRALDAIGHLVGPGELKGLLEELRPTTSAAPSLVRRLTGLTTRLTPVSRCLGRTVIGALQQTVPDGKHSTGRPVWQDMLHMGASLAGFSNTFDGNGTAFRASTTIGETALVAQLPGGQTLYGGGDIVGIAPQPLQSVKDYSYRPDAPCDQQALPDLSQRRSNSLPAGLRRVKAPEPNPAMEALLRGLMTRDRAGILRILSGLFPALARKPATQGGAGKHGVVPAKPTPARRPVIPLRPLPPTLPGKVKDTGDQVDKTVDDVIHSIGKLLGDRP